MRARCVGKEGRSELMVAICEFTQYSAGRGGTQAGVEGLLPAEFENAGPDEADVGDFTEDVEELIHVEIGKAIPFTVVYEPMGYEFDGSNDGIGGDGPDEPGVDEGVGGEAVDPDVFWGVEVGIVGDGDVAIFEAGDEVALEGEVAEGVADEEGEEEDEGAGDGEGIGGEVSGGEEEVNGFHGWGFWWMCGGKGECVRVSVPGGGLRVGFLGFGEFQVGGAEALAELGADLDEEEFAFRGVVVEEVFEHIAIDAPDLGEFDGGDGGTGFGGVEDIDFSEHISCFEGAEENFAALGFGLDVEEAGDDEEEGILWFALLDNDGVFVSREEFAVRAEETTFVFIHLCDDADIRQFGP